MNLKVKYLFPNIPELVSRDGDSGYDIRAAIDEPKEIAAGERVSLPTGIAVEIDTPARRRTPPATPRSGRRPGTPRSRRWPRPGQSMTGPGRSTGARRTGRPASAAP